jgi:hypothetical protein
MGQFWSSQEDDDPDGVDAWMVRRNAQLALRSQADTVGRDLWNQTIQNGGELYAGNPSDLTAIGLASLGEEGSYPTTAANHDAQGGYDALNSVAGSPEADPYGGGLGTSYQAARPAGSYSSTNSNPLLAPNPAPSPGPSRIGEAYVPTVSELEVMGSRLTPSPHPGFLDSLNHNPAVRLASGVAGYAIGLPAGVLRGGWHALEGLGDGLNFAASLFFPEGRAKAWNEAKAATHDALQYGQSVIANPSRLASDLAAQGKAAAHSLNPITPMADNAGDEWKKELGIGMNGGETAANIAGFFAAPEVFGGIKAASGFAATREANIAEMMARGLDEPTARYLSKPYEGGGDHALIQKSQKSVLGFKTPLLKAAPIPRWFMDGPLNVSRPRGLSQYDFYKYHYGVDGQFHGGSLPRHLNGGRGFSGARLGFERYNYPGRILARIPSIWKDYDAGVAAGDALRQLPQDATGTPQ